MPQTLQDAGLKSLNICLFASIGSGKSSYINTISNALEDFEEGAEVDETARAGENDKSYTLELTKYDIVSGIQLWDIWGWQSTKDYDALLELCEGRIKDGAKEGDQADKILNLNNFNFRPHCFLTFISGNDVASLEMLTKFGQYHTEIKSVRGL